MANSVITKRALSEALKELCKNQPLEKISISDITDYCGLIRQSFYYHFDDKKELLKWIYEAELMPKDKSKPTLNNYYEILKTFISNVEKDKAFYLQTITSYDSFFSNYLHSTMYEFFMTILNDNKNEIAFDEKQKGIFARFYASGFTGLVVSWIQGVGGYSAEEMILNLSNFILCFKADAKAHLNAMENAVK